MPRDYGPAGKWVHDRAHRIMREGETGEQYGGKKGKSVAYAIAVQQAHKLGKSPKGFKTPGGVREAKAKFDLPKKEYQKTASLAAFFDELEKIGGGLVGKMLTHELLPGVAGELPFRKRLKLGLTGLGQLVKSQMRKRRQ
jgi:hypothetical protein